MAHHSAFFAMLASLRRAAVRPLPLLLAIAVSALPLAAGAATKTWTSAVSGNWSDASKWTGGVPTTGDDVVVTVAGTYTVTLDVSATNLLTLTLGGASGTQTLVIPAGSTLSFDGAAGGTTSTVGANGVVQITGGTLNTSPQSTSGPYNFNIDGKLDWSDGTVATKNIAGSAVTVSATGVLAISGSATKLVTGGGNGLVSNATAGTWSGTGTLSINAGKFSNGGALTVAAAGAGLPLMDINHGQFNNDGTVTFAGDPTIHAILANGNGAVLNNGTLRKNGTAGTMNVNLDVSGFYNFGLIDVKTGTLAFNDLGSSGMGSSGPGNAFNADAGAAIVFSVPAAGGLPSAFHDTSFTGGGTQTLLGTAATGFNFHGNISATDLTLTNGQFGLGSNVVFSGTLDWNGGNLGTGGTGNSMTFAAGATLNVNPGVNPKLVNFCCGAPSFQNFGTVNFKPGAASVPFASNVGFWNRAGGVVNVQGSVALGMKLSEFRNDGTLQLGFPIQFDVAGAFGVLFNNTGTVNVNGSLLTMNADVGNGYTQTGGVTDLGAPNGAIAMSAGDGFTISGGTFKGNGSLGLNANFAVNAGGTVAPGASPGLISVTGPYNQSGGTLAIELNGTNPGVTYDQLAVSGAVTLGGPLTVTLGFSPALGTVFTILNSTGAGAITGTFTGLAEGATIVLGPTTLQISYVGGTGNDVTLTVVVAAATPTTTTVVPAPNPSVFGQSVTLTATVTGGVPPPVGARTNGAPLVLAVPTGTVQFKDGAANLGSPVTLSGSVATLTTSVLAVGPHSITAVYSGDAGSLPSTSPVVTQSVNPAATTTISSALPGTLAPGQSVTVSVSVAAVAPGAGTPPGTVAVLDGASVLCTVTLAAGAGSCSAALSSVGTHTLTASYVATVSFLASTSQPATVTVNATGSVSSTPVPTLREWALLVLALMVAGLAGTRLRRRDAL